MAILTHLRRKHHQPAAPASGLTVDDFIAAYEFETESTGETRLDSHTGNYDLTDDGTTDVQTSTSVGAYEGTQSVKFDKTNSSQRLRNSSFPNNWVDSDFTIHTYFRTQSSPDASGNYTGTIAAQWDSGQVEWALQWYRWTPTTQYQVQFVIRLGGASYYAYSVDTLGADVQYGVGITRIGDEIKFYLNGVLKDTLDVSGLGTTGTNASELRVGQGSSDARAVDGWVDSLFFFSKGATADEISDLYNGGTFKTYMAFWNASKPAPTLTQDAYVTDGANSAVNYDTTAIAAKQSTNASIYDREPVFSFTGCPRIPTTATLRLHPTGTISGGGHSTFDIFYKEGHEIDETTVTQDVLDALTGVLDTGKNKAFTDHTLGTPVDIDVTGLVAGGANGKVTIWFKGYSHNGSQQWTFASKENATVTGPSLIIT